MKQDCFQQKGSYFLIFLMIFFALGCGEKKGKPGVEDFKYKPKAKHQGRDVTPEQAYKMLQKDPKHTFLVDVRTRIEYQDIGHPLEAYNIPWKFYTTIVNKRKQYQKEKNKNFCADLKARFNPETDTLLMLCRSSWRTIATSNAAVDCGFKKNKVFNVMGGFEGDKAKTGPDKGKRVKSGWRLEGLPWTYKMERKLIYQPDLQGYQF